MGPQASKFEHRNCKGMPGAFTVAQNVQPSHVSASFKGLASSDRYFRDIAPLRSPGLNELVGESGQLFFFFSFFHKYDYSARAVHRLAGTRPPPVGKRHRACVLTPSHEVFTINFCLTQTVRETGVSQHAAIGLGGPGFNTRNCKRMLLALNQERGQQLPAHTHNTTQHNTVECSTCSQFGNVRGVPQVTLARVWWHQPIAPGRSVQRRGLSLHSSAWPLARLRIFCVFNVNSMDCDAQSAAKQVYPPASIHLHTVISYNIKHDSWIHDLVKHLCLPLYLLTSSWYVVVLNQVNIEGVSVSFQWQSVVAGVVGAVGPSNRPNINSSRPG